jgi:tetratricopeptide (TPR) repeat protein/transcriptional regulator with XRE-family HTH domain
MPRTASDATPNELLIYERERQHWTQEDVTEKVEGLGAEGPKTVGRWERGIIKPSPYYLRQLAALYGRSVEELGYTKGDRIPFFQVPFLRNSFFTGREDVLTRLHEILALRKSKPPLLPQALVGLGGVGKTQIAVEYAYRYMREYHTIVWLRADSAEVLASDFAAIATLINLPIKREQDQHKIIEAVKDWFTQMSRWLLIFDNADHPERVYDFLPSPCYGHILLTTRSHATATYAQPIEIAEMAPEVGTYFLLRRGKVIGLEASSTEVSEMDYKDALVITEALGGLPLALDQAGAYIEETGCGLSRYASLYRTYRETLLQYRGDATREYPHSVATTWSLAFESIHSTNPVAGELLHLFAFLAPDAIPEEILTEGASALNPLLQPLAPNSLALDFALRDLLRYSLVRRNAATKMFSVHRLVQAVLKDRLDENTQRLWAECVVKAVNQLFPDVEATTWSTCQRYLPQAQVCANLIEQWDMHFAEAAHLLYQTGCYLRDRAQYAQAEVLLKRALTLRKELLGPKHPEIATTIDSLASTYFEQGKYLQAESLFQQALAIREQAFGTEHPEVAKSLNDLAHLRYFIHENTYDEAEQMFRRALAIREKALGKDHPDVALTLQTFGHLYNYQGKYEQALALYQRALEIRERVLGSDHPDLVDLLTSMGRNYHRMGKDDQAEDLYQRAIVICEAVAPEHPQLGLLLDNMGILSMDHDIYDQAEQYFKRSLTIHEKVLGMVHPHIAKCLNNFALLQSRLASFDQAEALALRALTIHEQTVGPEHADCTIVLTTLASVYLAQGKYAQTAPVLQRALTILQKDQRSANPILADAYVQSAQLAFSEERYSEAEILYQKGLTMLEEIFGIEHLDIAETLLKIAKHFIVQGKYSQAEPLCTQALVLYEKRQRINHIDAAQGLAILALLKSKQGQYEEAEALCTHAGAIYIEALGPKHPSVAFCLSILAGAYQSQGDYTRAKSLSERALEIWEQTVAPEHIDLVACKERYRALLHTLTEDRETQAQG